MSLDTETAVAERPLVTALINTFNYARYLPFAINSVLAQTYDNIELVIVDDGSTDHTAEVLAQYKDKARIILTENGGQGHAFNVGIAAAKGDLIMMLDADDVWLPEKVATMVKLAARNPDAGMLYHRFINVDNAGNELDLPSPGTLVNGDHSAAYINSGGSYWAPVTSVLAFRAEQARRLIPIPTLAVREGADNVLTDCSILLGKVCSIPDVLTQRRLHGKNLYASGRESHFRSPRTREEDVRRIEWRMYCNQRVMRRLDRPFAIDIERNEWRIMNLYWLGRAPLWKVLRACLLCQDHKKIADRIGRVMWVVRLKKFAQAYSRE